jgi:GTPase SAR1 family protein
MTTQNFDIPGTLNFVGANQYNISNHYANIEYLTGTSSNPPVHQAPFIEAPIDLLSIHKKELGRMTEAFERTRRNVPLRCVLFGNHGVGKTQLTYEWAKRTFVQEVNPYILWISATTVEKLCQGFCRLLHIVNHPDRSHPDQSVRLTAARRWFEQVDTGNWLLVLDNVSPDTLDFLRQHLPRQNGQGSILFTTLTESVAVALASTAGERHDVIEVPLLDVQDSVELFLGHFDQGELNLTFSKVEKIVKSVGCLPLAIAHAAAYMTQTRTSVDDMLKFYLGERKINVSLPSSFLCCNALT